MKMIVVFSGYNQRAVVAFLRCLTRNNINNYVIIAASENDTILKSEYSRKVICIRKKVELDINEICNILHCIRKKYNIDLMLIPPTTEALNRFLLEHRRKIEKQQCIIPLVEKKLYEEISDKENFWILCQKNGLDVPSEIKLTEKFKQPYVAKPRHYYSNDGKVYSPILILNSELHDQFINKYDTNEFIYQKYIYGDSYYIMYYFSKNGEVNSFSQKNHAQQPNGKSILAASTSKIHQKDIGQKYIKIFQQLNYFGFVMVELRKNQNVFYMIEANPRFWGPSQLFVDAGVPLFEAFLKDYNFIEQIKEREINYDTKYLWSGGSDKQMINSENSVWLGEGKQIVIKDWQKFLKFDVYRREDTMGIFEFENKKGRH